MTLFLRSEDLDCAALESRVAEADPATEVCWLQKNRLEALPESLFIRLPSLKQLYLSDNAITAVPESISRLSLLEGLHLQRNPLSALPASLLLLRHLRVLGLKDTGLPVALAVDAESRAQVEHLLLDARHLGCIDIAPPQIATRLEQVKQSTTDARIQGSYSEVPAQLLQAESLEMLDLSGCPGISELPLEISRLTNLQMVVLHDTTLRRAELDSLLRKLPPDLSGSSGGVASWSTDDVCRHLETLGLPAYHPCLDAVRAQFVDGAALLQCSEEELRAELNVPLGIRKAHLRFMQHHQQQQQHK